MQAVEPPSLMECLRANGEPATVTSRDRTRAGGHSRGSAPPASSILRALGGFGEASGSLETPYFTRTKTASEQFVAARVGGADEPLRGGGFPAGHGQVPVEPGWKGPMSMRFPDGTLALEEHS